MRKRNLISSIVLLVMGLAMMAESMRLPFGSLRAPEVGFLPLILAILLIALSLIFLVQSIRRQKNEKEVPLEMRFGNWVRIGLALFALVASTLFFESLGYIINSFFLVAFLLCTVEPQKWWIAVGIALLSSFGSYILFVSLLGTTLPKGIFGF